MKATSAQLVINLLAAAIPALLRQFGHESASSPVEDCSPTAVAFFKALAANDEGLTTEQTAAVLKVAARSIPPMIRAAKRALAEAGESFERFVRRETLYQRGKPYSVYRLTAEGRRWLQRAE